MHKEVTHRVTSNNSQCHLQCHQFERNNEHQLKRMDSEAHAAANLGQQIVLTQ